MHALSFLNNLAASAGTLYNNEFEQMLHQNPSSPRSPHSYQQMSPLQQQQFMSALVGMNSSSHLPHSPELLLALSNPSLLHHFSNNQNISATNPNNVPNMPRGLNSSSNSNLLNQQNTNLLNNLYYQQLAQQMQMQNDQQAAIENEMFNNRFKISSSSNSGTSLDHMDKDLQHQHWYLEALEAMAKSTNGNSFENNKDANTESFSPWSPKHHKENGNN